MNTAICRYSKGELKCNNVRFERDGKAYSAEIENPYQHIVFVTEITKKVLCSGIDFKVFAWGAELYTLWVLPKGLNKCIIMDRAVINTIKPWLLYIAPSLEEPSEKVVRYAEYIRYLIDPPSNYVILIDKRTGHAVSWKNLVAFLQPSDIVDHIYHLMTQIMNKKIADKIIVAIKERKIPPQMLAYLNRVNMGKSCNCITMPSTEEE